VGAGGGHGGETVAFPDDHDPLGAQGHPGARRKVLGLADAEALRLAVRGPRLDEHEVRDGAQHT